MRVLKRACVALAITVGVTPATAAARSAAAPRSQLSPTGRHFGVYRYEYRQARRQYGSRSVGCELVYTCRSTVSDAEVVASTLTLERMLHPVVTFHASGGVPRPPGLPYGQWAIPAYIVYCESTFQNLPPNSAGASGYYQIIPSTWTAYGGGVFASEAYLAAKAGQDTVAARIWAGGSGASQWVCA